MFFQMPKKEKKGWKDFFFPLKRIFLSCLSDKKHFWEKKGVIVKTE